VNTDAQTATEQIIWVEGDATLVNTTRIGCGVGPADGLNPGEPCPADEIKPSILIIDGNATFDGPDILGLVYVTGNATITNSTDIQGAVIVGGALNNVTSASLDLVYNSDVLKSTRLGGNMIPVSGSWKDFN
jgi:hypothetical protein